MTEHAPDRIWSGIDIGKTLAGTLAAVSAAVVGSFLGVAGTLVGAAVASIVGSVGTEVYHRWINRSSKRIKATFVTAPAATGTPPVAAAEDEKPSEEDPAIPPAPTRIRWGRVALISLSLFVLAMVALSAFELITRQSVAEAVGGTSGKSTTIGSVLTGNHEDTETPATTPSESAPATDGSEQNSDPTGTPTPDPAASPANQPAAPTDTATQPPTDTTTTDPTQDQNQQGTGSDSDSGSDGSGSDGSGSGSGGGGEGSGGSGGGQGGSTGGGSAGPTN